MLYCMCFGKMSFSWELELRLFRHQARLVIVLHFYNEAERAACCQFNYQICLKTDSMFALIIKKKRQSLFTEKLRMLFTKHLLINWITSYLQSVLTCCVTTGLKFWIITLKVCCALSCASVSSS